jgi:hypothetical protein
MQQQRNTFLKITQMTEATFTTIRIYVYSNGSSDNDLIHLFVL